MLIARFSIQDKLEKTRFFEETFFVADIGIEAKLEMLFLSLSNIDIRFADTSEFTWKNCTTTEVLHNIKKVEVIHRKEFAQTALDENAKIRVVYVATLLALFIHPSWELQLRSLLADYVSTEVASKYSDYTNVFLPDLIKGLPEHTGMIDYTIELKEGN